MDILDFCRLHFSHKPCFHCELSEKLAKEEPVVDPRFNCVEHRTQYSPCWECLHMRALKTDACHCAQIRLQKALEIEASPFNDERQKALLQALNVHSVYCVPCLEARGYDPDAFNEKFNEEYQEWAEELEKKRTSHE